MFATISNTIVDNKKKAQNLYYISKLSEGFVVRSLFLKEINCNLMLVEGFSLLLMINTVVKTYLKQNYWQCLFTVLEEGVPNFGFTRNLN